MAYPFVLPYLHVGRCPHIPHVVLSSVVHWNFPCMSEMKKKRHQGKAVDTVAALLSQGCCNKVPQLSGWSNTNILLFNLPHTSGGQESKIKVLASQWWSHWGRTYSSPLPASGSLRHSLMCRQLSFPCVFISSSFYEYLCVQFSPLSIPVILEPTLLTSFNLIISVKTLLISK